MLHAREVSIELCLQKWSTYRSNLATSALSLSRHISLSHRLSSIDGRPGSTMTLGKDEASSGLSE